MINRLFGYLFFASIFVQHSIVLSRVCDFPNQPRKIDLKINSIVHPAGPITRREWLLNTESILYRLEVDGAKSGQIAVNKTKLIYNAVNGWGLTDFDGNLILKIGKFDLDKKANLKIEFIDEKWSLHIRRQYIPVILPGIAVESEESLDVTFIRLC
jgi:hypothetical protein